jgi:hypothetical protein
MPAARMSMPMAWPAMLVLWITFNQIVFFLGTTETGPQSLYDVPRSARLQPRSSYDQLRAGPPLPVKSRKRLVAKI